MKHIILNTALILYILLMTASYLSGYKPLIVSSNSMSPALNKGDLLIVAKNDQYEVGDIISFKNQGNIVSHRIESKVENGFNTKGDANISLDFGSIINESIVGRVEFVVPYFGFLFIYLQSRNFFYLLLIILIYLLFRKLKNVKK